MNSQLTFRLASLLACSTLIVACGGGGGGGSSGGNNNPPPAQTFTVGGSVSGLSGTVVLQNNGGNNLSVTANGNFTFSTALANASAYAVTVLTQPTGQTCTVGNGSGTLNGANVTNVTVTCANNQAQTFTIGGTVSGLASGASVVLQNNAANNLSVTANGAFTFTTALANSAAYAVTVLTQPTSPSPGQNCTVGNGSGTVNGANVTNVTVTCANLDQTAPTVTARAPLPTSVGSKVQGGVITVTFSEPINTASVTSSSFTVQSAAGPVTGTISFGAGNTQATFTPGATLAFDTSYTVTVTTGVTDPSGNALPGNVTWGFNTGKRLAFGFQHTCSRLDDGRIKCWGQNNRGQLGYDDTTDRGDNGGEMGNALPAVNLGTGRTAVAISAGDYQTCAILDNGDTKCWGSNGSGEAGQGITGGSSTNFGDAAGEMAALQPINFGTGRRALEVASGQFFTCARLDDNSVKCWGRNDSGMLGQGNLASLGVAAGDIAAAAPVDLGAGLTPIALSLGHHHACAVLVDSSGTRHAKCWGDNRWGQLGRGDTVNRGDNAGEMGAALPDLSLGTSLTVDTLMATGGHSCAKLSDLSTKCWGLNTWGQVGLNAGNNNPVDPLLCAGANDCIGDQPSEMGDSLLPAIAAGLTAKMSVGYRHGCVLTTGAALNCWGTNQEGQLGLGDIAPPKDIIGNDAGEMGALAATALKPGKIVEELTAGGFSTCVFNTDDTLNCWGNNDQGQLGQGNTSIVGDGPNEMGANLVDVDLGT